MIGSVQVRRAEESDAAEIARLASEFGYPSTAAEITARLRALLPDPKQFVAVAPRETSGLLGWVAAERRLLLESGERAELVGLVVAAPARRSGVGCALVGAAEQWAAGQGLSIISVRSNIARVESHPFYESIGYTRKKTQHSYAKRIAV